MRAYERKALHSYWKLKNSVKSIISLIGVLTAVLLDGAYADVEPCVQAIPINAMTTKEDGIYRFMDGRELKGTVHMVGGCHEQADFPTGG